MGQLNAESRAFKRYVINLLRFELKIWVQWNWWHNWASILIRDHPRDHHLALGEAWGLQWPSLETQDRPLAHPRVPRERDGCSGIKCYSRDGFFSFQCQGIPLGCSDGPTLDPIGFVLVICLTTSLVLVLGLTTGLVDPANGLLDPVGVLMDPGLPFSFFRVMGFSAGWTGVACFFSNIESLGLEGFRSGSEGLTGMLGVAGFRVGPAGVCLDPPGEMCLGFFRQISYQCHDALL